MVYGSRSLLDFSSAKADDFCSEVIKLLAGT